MGAMLPVKASISLIAIVKAMRSAHGAVIFTSVMKTLAAHINVLDKSPTALTFSNAKVNPAAALPGPLTPPSE